LLTHLVASEKRQYLIQDLTIWANSFENYFAQTVFVNALKCMQRANLESVIDHIEKSKPVDLFGENSP
jgi:hypothetical protein